MINNATNLLHSSIIVATTKVIITSITTTASSFIPSAQTTSDVETTANSTGTLNGE